MFGEFLEDLVGGFEALLELPGLIEVEEVLEEGGLF